MDLRVNKVVIHIHHLQLVSPRQSTAVSEKGDMQQRALLGAVQAGGHLPAHARDEDALRDLALQQLHEGIAVFALLAPPFLAFPLLFLCSLLLQVPACGRHVHMSCSAGSHCALFHFWSSTQETPGNLQSQHSGEPAESVAFRQLLKEHMTQP